MHAAVAADDAHQLPAQQQQVWQEAGALVGLLDDAAVPATALISSASA